MRSCATLVASGASQKTIATALNLSKYQAHRLMKKMTADGYVRDSVRSSAKFYVLTKSGEAFMKSEHEVAQLPYGMEGSSTTPGFNTTPEREKIVRGSHDLNLRYPISNPESAVKIPPSFWDNKWKLPNGQKKCKFIERPAPMTITMNQGCKSLTVQLHDFEVHDNMTVHSKIFHTSWNMFRLFLRRFDVMLDVDRMAVMNEHKTYEDDDSRKLAAHGKKFRVMLGRDREKYTPQDPEQAAWVELDRTPGDNWETNDRSHDEKRALMPETVDKTAQDVAQLKEMMLGFVQRDVATANAQNYTALAIKRNTDFMERQTEILEKMADRAPGESPEIGSKLEDIEGCMKVLLRKELLEAPELGPLDKFLKPEETQIEMLKTMERKVVPYRGVLRAIGPFSPGARFYVDSRVAAVLEKAGMAKVLPYD